MYYKRWIPNLLISGCRTANGTETGNKKCLFPFIVDGIIRNQCIKNDQGDFICPTFLNDDLTMPPGSFGICNAGCPGTGTGR